MEKVILEGTKTEKYVYRSEDLASLKGADKRYFLS